MRFLYTFEPNGTKFVRIREFRQENKTTRTTGDKELFSELQHVYLNSSGCVACSEWNGLNELRNLF